MRRFFALFMLAIVPGLHAQIEEVAVSASLEGATGHSTVVVRFAVPPHHYVYADHVAIAAPPVALTPLETPTAKLKDDPFSGEKVGVYDHDVTFTYRPGEVPSGGIPLVVGYQACNDSICFRPMTETFQLGGVAVAAPPDLPRRRRSGLRHWRHRQGRRISRAPGHPPRRTPKGGIPPPAAGLGPRCR